MSSSSSSSARPNGGSSFCSLDSLLFSQLKLFRLSCRFSCLKGLTLLALCPLPLSRLWVYLGRGHLLICRGRCLCRLLLASRTLRGKEIKGSVG